MGFSRGHNQRHYPLEKYLDVLNILLASVKVDAKWTKGAVICGLNNCLQKASAPICRWMDKGCW